MNSIDIILLFVIYNLVQYFIQIIQKRSLVMLQFVNSTVLLSKTTSNKRLSVNKKIISKDLLRSQSSTNLVTNSQQKVKTGEVKGQNLQQKVKTGEVKGQNLPKKSLKQLLHRKQYPIKQIQKKPSQSLQNINASNHYKLLKNQALKVVPNIHDKQSTQRKHFRTFGQGFATKQKEKKTDAKYIVKKRVIRNTNIIKRKVDSVYAKKSKSFVKNPFISSNTTYNYSCTQKEELYYIDELKRQLSKIDLYQQDDAVPPMIIGHFFQSISTFYRFKGVKEPQQLHLSVFLPKNKRNKSTLIFDMDETIIHAEPYKQNIHSNSWGQNMEIKVDDGSKVMINLKIRPFAVQVLGRLKDKFQIGIFTAAHQSYAKQIIKKFDPQNTLFDFALFRQHCHVVQGKLAIKDLRIISNRSLKNLILIDNSPHTYLYQPQNAVPIISFYKDNNDQQMLKLEKFVNSAGLQKKQDIRPFLKNLFQFHKYTHFRDIQQLVDTLYTKPA